MDHNGPTPNPYIAYTVRSSNLTYFRLPCGTRLRLFSGCGGFSPVPCTVTIHVCYVIFFTSMYLRGTLDTKLPKISRR